MLNLLRDEPELLAIADALTTIAPPRPDRDRQPAAVERDRLGGKEPRADDADAHERT